MSPVTRVRLPAARTPGPAVTRVPLPVARTPGPRVSRILLPAARTPGPALLGDSLFSPLRGAADSTLASPGRSPGLPAPLLPVLSPVRPARIGKTRAVVPAPSG